MRVTKIITAIITFSATFLLSVFIAGLFITTAAVPVVETVTVSPYRHKCSKTELAKDIDRFIEQDIRNGETRMDNLYRSNGARFDFDSEQFAEQADAISEYSDTSAAMDDSDFPQDFREAWREHMRAWRNFADFMENTSRAGKFKSESEFVLREIEYNREISRTWYEVLRIGRKYGAETRGY